MAINLTNLISNGSFETNATGWSCFYTDNRDVQNTLTPTIRAVSTPHHGEVGTNSLQLTVKTQGVIYMNLTQPLAVIVGHKYYIRARVNLTGTPAGSVSVCTIVNTTTTPARIIAPPPMSDGLQTTDITDWILIDTIWTADTPNLNLRIIWQTTANQGNNDNSGQIDNVVVIDLTSDFGSTLEPPLFAIQGGINNPSFPNGHFDGTAAIDMPIPPIIKTTQIPPALRDRDYTAKIEIEENTGTPGFIFAISGLPIGHGLTIDSDGNITGQPHLEDGSYQLTVSVTDHIGYQVSEQFTLSVGEPPVILDEFIPGASFGLDYSFIPTVEGSLPIAVTLSVSYGFLPDGLSIIGDEILGTPITDGQTCVITITAKNDYDTIGVNKTFQLAVYSAPYINTVQLPNGVLSEPYTKQLSVSGIPEITISHISGDLPPGITLDEFGLFSGTPTHTGVYSFSVLATNDLGSYARVFTISVFEPPVITTIMFGYARLGTQYSGQLTARGSQPIEFSIISGSLPVGLTLNPTTGIISGVALSAGLFSFTVVASNGAGNSPPVAFTIDAGLSIAITTRSPLPDGTVGVAYPSLQLLADGVDSTFASSWAWVAQGGSSVPSGLVLASNTGLISGIPTTAGVFNILITLTNGPSVTTSPFVLEIGTPPTITTAAQLTGGVDRPFTIVLEASSTTPVSWRQATPPPWPDVNISLQPNGALSWLIPLEGEYLFSVIATNSFGDSAPKTFTLTITTPAIIDVELENGVVGEQYYHKFSASGAQPFTWELIGELPYGLSFDAQNAIISGVPVVEESRAFEVKLSNAGGSVTESFNISIFERPIILTTSLNSSNVSMVYSGQILASGSSPISFSVVSGSLPDGLYLSGSIISGITANYPGTYTFTIRAENITGGNFADEKSFTIEISAAGTPVITTNANLSMIRGIYKELVFEATNMEVYGSWSIVGSLPAGLSFLGDTISGTPTLAGVFQFDMVATNLIGFDTRSFTLTIADPPTITTTTLQDGGTNVSYSDTLLATGDMPISWQVLSPISPETGLPAGLSLHYATGVISGKPTTAGTYSFRVRAYNAAGEDIKSLSITIENRGGTFINGKKIANLFIAGKEVGVAFVNGERIYR